MNVKISVVIPFFSNLNWLIQALKSIEKQSYKDYEVIIINDGSDHDLSDLLNIFSFKLKILKINNSGPSYARNIGIEESRGKYIAFLDSDDLWLPNKLEKQVNAMESRKSIWSQHSYIMKYEKNNKYKHQDTKKYSGNVYVETFISLKIQTSTIMVLRDYLIKNNIKFPVNLRYGEDGEFYRQIAIENKLLHVDDFLSIFRIRDNNAGFNPQIQLEDRSRTWNRIKNNNILLSRLPKSIIFSYNIASIVNNLSLKLEKKLRCKINYRLYYIFYMPSYMIFKYNSRFKSQSKFIN